MKKKSRFLQTPVEPFAVEPGLTADQVLARMERISFQGRNLATARRVWQKMLEDDVTIFLGMAGALSAGGLRLIVAHLITQPLRRLPRLDRRESVSRPPRNARPAPLHRLAARRRCRARRRSHRPRLRHVRRARKSSSATTTGSPTSPRTLEPRAVHDARVPVPARRPPVEHDRARRHPDGGLPRQRADLLPGHRRLVDRHGPVAGAAEAGRRRPHRHHRRHRRVGEPHHPPAAHGVGRARRRHAQELHQPGERAGRVLQRPRSSGHRYALQIVTDVPHFGGASGVEPRGGRRAGASWPPTRRASRSRRTRPIALPMLASALADVGAARCSPGGARRSSPWRRAS